MKQTAVEWLDNAIKDLIPNDIGSQLKYKNKIEQAKEMEKKQNYNLDNLRDAYRWGTTVSIGTSDHFEEFLHNIKKKIK